MKKYEFTGETKPFNGVTLRRIKRLKDGLIGGWIEKENNLSHYGECFVYDNAEVRGNARVFGNAKVYGNAWVSGDAKVFGSAEVGDNARVFGSVRVCGYAVVNGNARVFDDSRVYDSAQVGGNARVCGDARVYGSAKVKKPTDIITFNFGEFHCTATKSDMSVVIGCQRKTIEEWLMVSKNDATLMGIREEFFATYKSFIQFVKIHFERKDIQ